MVLLTADNHYTAINNLTYDGDPGDPGSPPLPARNAFEIHHQTTRRRREVWSPTLQCGGVSELAADGGLRRSWRRLESIQRLSECLSGVQLPIELDLAPVLAGMDECVLDAPGA